MKNLKDTKDTFTMHLLYNEMCIFAQDRPYQNTDLLVKFVMNYNFDKNLVTFRKCLATIKVKVEIVTQHPDGILMYQGKKIVKFIYISSCSESKFSVNGRTNLKEAMHTSVLKHLESIGVINDKREVQGDSPSGKVLPERSSLQG